MVKQATSQIDVLWFLCLRFSLAASIMLPFVRRVSTDPTRSPFRPDVTVAGVGIGLVLAGSYLMQTFGLQYVEATISGLITGLFVVLGPVLNRLIFGVGIRPLHWCAVMASLLGSVC